MAQNGNLVPTRLVFLSGKGTSHLGQYSESCEEICGCIRHAYACRFSVASQVHVLPVPCGQLCQTLTPGAPFEVVRAKKAQVVSCIAINFSDPQQLIRLWKRER